MAHQPSLRKHATGTKTDYTLLVLDTPVEAWNKRFLAALRRLKSPTLGRRNVPAVGPWEGRFDRQRQSEGSHISPSRARRAPRKRAPAAAEAPVRYFQGFIRFALNHGTLRSFDCRQYQLDRLTYQERFGGFGFGGSVVRSAASGLAPGASQNFCPTDCILKADGLVALYHADHTLRIPSVAVDRLAAASVHFCGDPVRRQSRVLQFRNGRQVDVNIETVDKSEVVTLSWKDDAPHRH
jgi:hypothetical protein